MTTAKPWVRHYQPGVPAEIDDPNGTLPNLLDDAVAGGADFPALEFFGRRTTYTELGRQVARAAAGLHRLGVRAGDHVAILLPNCPQHVVAFYAIARLGAVVVEHNPLYTPRELRHMFEDHAARVVICWDSGVSKLRELPEDVAPEHIVSVNLLTEFPPLKRFALGLPIARLRRLKAALTAPAPGTIPWQTLLDNPPLSPKHPRPRSEDLAAIQYTSGTTGAPKGALLSHRNLYANALQGEAWMHDAQYRQENVYALLPMFHSFGMTLYLTFAIRKQSTVVLFPKFDVDMVLDAAKKTPPTVYCAVPPIYKRTAERARERGVSLATARLCISGAMKLSDDIVEAWEGVTGGLLVEGYGMTEASPVAMGNPFTTARKVGTIGIPFPSTDMKVTDPADPTREVAPGEPGELLIRGPQVFSGYLNNPEATAEVLTDDGWLRTGDIVVVDEDGFATIVDRAKEIIITGGFNVSPSEVEAVLRSHPDIADAAVVGINEHHGERVAAVVELQAGARLDVAGVIAFCKERLAGYKVPRQITATDELPKSMLGKVLRKQVRDSLVAKT